MNVLLIYPKFPDTFWSFTYALKFIRKKAAFPPLGLLTIAAMLPDEFHSRLVDVNADGLTDDDLSWADLAFIGAMAVQRDSAKQIIARCKATGFSLRNRMRLRRWITLSSTRPNSHYRHFWKT
jgi:hypothetical protein